MSEEFIDTRPGVRLIGTTLGPCARKIMRIAVGSALVAGGMVCFSVGVIAGGLMINTFITTKGIIGVQPNGGNIEAGLFTGGLASISAYLTYKMYNTGLKFLDL
jgi:hypothetical protein